MTPPIAAPPIGAAPIGAAWPHEPAPVAPERRRLGDVLLERGLLTPAELASALAAQGHARDDPSARRRRLGRVVVELGLATERQVAEALADLLGLDVVDLAREPVSAETARLLPRQVADRGRVLVLSRTATGGLRVATADPTNVVALDDVRLYTNATELTVVVATESQIRDQIARLWSLSEESADVTTMIEEIGPDHAEDPEPAAADADARLVNMILADAVRQGASDIHVEPQRDSLRIRYRIDGLLRDVMTVPRAAAAALVSRVKIISGLDIAERRVPQDGRARLSVDGVFVDARVSSLPSLHGEKVVLRLLARADAVPTITQLGLDDRQLETTLSALGAPQRLVLITGPTGSGKTNTLYAAISRIQTPERNVVTLEDPVEIQLAGITQVQVHEKSGLTFARGLRSILRQDPDIVLVGEVRDRETAQLALQASLTGHLVLTTLHTNDAVSALTRLVDMGVEPFLVASSLALVVAQRLVRRPCPNCAVPSPPPPRVLASLGLADEGPAPSPCTGAGASTAATAVIAGSWGSSRCCRSPARCARSCCAPRPRPRSRPPPARPG